MTPIATCVTDASTSRRPGYPVVAALLVLWLACLVAIAIAFEPNLYWFSYYSVDYTLGFVRRGLAGEMLGLFPTDEYHTGLLTLRWLQPALYIVALVTVALTVAFRFGASERRLKLALLIPVLPFGFAFAVFSAHPDLFGAVALAGFALVLGVAKTDRSIMIASAAYGFTTAILTLAHEAIPLLFSLGAIMAIVVLGVPSSINVQRCSTLFAVAPGLAVALTTALVARRGISSELCALVPHIPVDWPAAGGLSVSQVLNGQHFYIDYHDWMCRNIIGTYDQTVPDAAGFVASIGAPWLVASTVFGVALLAMTVFAIGHISGAPFGPFWALLRERPFWMILGAVVVLPVFVTSVDWVRWWVTISFGVGVVYALYASGQPEATGQPTRRTRILFAAGLVLLALFPVGVIAGFGVPPPV